MKYREIANHNEARKELKHNTMPSKVSLEIFLE